MIGNTRKTSLEQFYTPLATATELVRKSKEAIGDWERFTWVEPAAGSGSFLRAMRDEGIANTVAMDITPKSNSEKIENADFLKSDISLDSAVVLTNPPFGRCNSLSVKFFNKASALGARYVCFIVPRSWRKWSVQNKLDRRYHLIVDDDLQVDYTGSQGNKLSKSNALRTCFQIWEKRDTLREQIEVKNSGYIRKTTPELANVAITTFGWSCGRVETDFIRTPNTTKLYLCAKDLSVIDALKSLQYERFFNNVAHVQSLSMNEIVFLLNEKLDAVGNVRSNSL